MAAAGAMSVAGTVTRGSKAASQSAEETPVVLECAINGSTRKARNPLAPDTPAELHTEIMNCLDAGATIVHLHSNRPNENVMAAAQPYIEACEPIWNRHPHAIVYGTANFDPAVYNRERKAWVGEVQCGHHRILSSARLSVSVPAWGEAVSWP